VTVTDRLPKGVDVVSAATSVGRCARAGKKISCDLGSLNAPTIDYGAPPTVTIAVIPRQIGTISNTATVEGQQKDPLAENNKATVTTSVVGPPATCRGVPATIVGTAGSDSIVGTAGRDVIVAFSGNDSIFSLAGRDLVCAGSGDDHVGAGSAADRVLGGAGQDRLIGRGGPDVLRGNAGNDVLEGGRGDDRLRGGSGFDRCRGGAGANSIRSCER
jgi:Ca2+-binding RTX toxin-like protein